MRNDPQPPQTRGPDDILACRLSGMSSLRLIPANWLSDLFVVAVAIAILMACRGGLMLSLWDHAGANANGLAVLIALVRGFPFDCRTATVACLPLLVASLSAWRWPAETVRRQLRAWWLASFTGIALLVTVCDHYYFREYGDQFNHFLFGAMYDDRSAILGTMWKEYPVIRALLATGATIAAVGWVALRLFRWRPLAARFTTMGAVPLALCTIGLLAAIVCAARGSVSRLPAQSKNVAVTPDAFLNKLVLNPFAAFDQAVGAYKESRSDTSIATWIPDGEVRAAAKRWFATDADLPDLDAYAERTARGTATRPSHVVLLILESCSGWAFDPRWRALQLDEGLRQLGDQGVRFDRFISAGPGTIYSVGPLLTGLADTGLEQSYLRSCTQPFPTSLAPMFKRLGYRTRFHYSGYLSWQRLGDLVQGQGFDEVHGGGEISNWLSGQEWGVDDEHLLDWVSERIDPATPTLDVILTTSNHPPYNVDVVAKGYPLRDWPAGMDHAGGDDLRVLGHHWYGCRTAAEFVERVRARCPQALFAITGDHFGRRFPNAHPDAFERLAVPGILVGQGIDARQLVSDRAGSHLDLIPTLVERCAPAGFVYHAFGHDLLADPPTPVAVSPMGAIGLDGAVVWNAGEASGPDANQAAQWKRRSDDLAGLAWWRLIRGAGFADPGR